VAAAVYFIYKTNSDEIWNRRPAAEKHHRKWTISFVDQEQNSVYFCRILIVRRSLHDIHSASAVVMATVHPTINDQLTRVQLRLLKQVLRRKCFSCF